MEMIGVGQQPSTYILLMCPLPDQLEGETAIIGWRERCSTVRDGELTRKKLNKRAGKLSTKSWPDQIPRPVGLLDPMTLLVIR